MLLSACSAQKELPPALRTVVGIVCVTGNEPFTNLSLQTEDGAMVKIRKDTSAIVRKLIELQGQRLRVQFRSTQSQPDTSSIVVEHVELVKIP